MVIVRKTDIVKGLRDLGLNSGHIILAHSSLSSFGHVEGGADTVIDALIETVGSNGTVIVPTLTGDESLCPKNPPVFDPEYTPCWTGIIPEIFRKRQNAVRSIHPTHSVSAIGPNAVSLTKNHAYSVTPCDELSPYGELAQREDSYILLIGVNHEVSTMFHHVEELVGVDYHMQEEFVKAKIILEGRETFRHTMIHRYGAVRNFNVMQEIFIEQRIQRQTKIGNSNIRLVKVREMVQTTVRCLRSNRRILCAKT